MRFPANGMKMFGAWTLKNNLRTDAASRSAFGFQRQVHATGSHRGLRCLCATTWRFRVISRLYSRSIRNASTLWTSSRSAWTACSGTSNPCGSKSSMEAIVSQRRNGEVDYLPRIRRRRTRCAETLDAPGSRPVFRSDVESSLRERCGACPTRSRAHSRISNRSRSLRQPPAWAHSSSLPTTSSARPQG